MNSGTQGSTNEEYLSYSSGYSRSSSVEIPPRRYKGNKCSKLAHGMCEVCKRRKRLITQFNRWKGYKLILIGINEMRCKGMHCRRINMVYCSGKMTINIKRLLQNSIGGTNYSDRVKLRNNPIKINLIQVPTWDKEDEWRKTSDDQIDTMLKNIKNK